MLRIFKILPVKFVLVSKSPESSADPVPDATTAAGATAFGLMPLGASVKKPTDVSIVDLHVLLYRVDGFGVKTSDKTPIGYLLNPPRAPSADDPKRCVLVWN